MPVSTHSLAPRFYRTPPSSRHRVTLLGGDVNPCGRGEAAAAALALAVVTANALNADLRVIAKRPVDPSELDRLLHRQGLVLRGECSLPAPSTRPDAELDRFEGELMITASWSVAADALHEMPGRDLVLLVHADGPPPASAAERARHHALLSRNDLRFVVCTQALQRRLAANGLPHFEHAALTFEPARVASDTDHRSVPDDDGLHFVLHVAESTNRRHFALALQAIEHALAAGMLEPDRWSFTFVGLGLPQVTLRNGQRPVRQDTLDAAGPANRPHADLALVLPPAAPEPAAAAMAHSGTVVIIAAPSDADAAHPGVISCDATPDALSEALRQAVARLAGPAGRVRPATEYGPAADWAQVLRSVAPELTAGR